MDVTKDAELSSDRKKWNLIFNGLVNMIQTQQSQLQFLEQRLKSQHQRWISDVNLLKQQRSQMKKMIKVREMDRTVEAAKSEMFLSLKKTESMMYKLKLESSQCDLEGFKEWFDILVRKCAESNDGVEDVNKKGVDNKSLEREVRRVKHEIERLNSEKTSQLTALLKENDFVWNQYKVLERDLSDKVKNKQAEVEQANEKIKKLVTGMEQSQASNTEKDDLILNLKNDMANLESDSLAKTKEISRLSRELELYKKSRNDTVTPEIRRCTAAGRGQLGGKNSIVYNGNVTVKKEVSSSQDAEKGSKNSKRRILQRSSISEPPKLISSRFKVPKLKNSSPSVT